MSNKWNFSSRLSYHAESTLPQRDMWNLTTISVAATLIAAPLAIFAIALLTNLDLTLADRAFDFHTNVFPLRHAWVTEVLNHVILKRLFIVMAVAVFLTVGWDILSPRPWSWIRRFQLRIVALSAVFIPTVISFIKLQSDSHCPWDLERYGGTEPYVRLYETMPTGVLAGNCMPAGHASSALWLISLAIFFVPHRLKLAGSTLVAFLMLGFAVGWMQQLRGAHFFTHTLWSIWIALATLFVITLAMDRWPERRGCASLRQTTQIG